MPLPVIPVRGAAPLKEAAVALKLHVLASGSSGNSTLVESGDTRVLVDCGISGSEATRRLAKVDCHPGSLKAIIVSHEHADHIQGVGILSRRHGIPVYLTEGTLRACNGQVDSRTDTRVFEPDREFDVGELGVRPFSIPHDAAEPVGFTFHSRGVKAGLATDLGFSTALARQHLSGCRFLVLESNHDPELLARSPYPWELKRRIRSRRGHLSNEEACQLLEGVLHEELETVVLAHLSEKSNLPGLAVKAAERVLEKYRLRGRVGIEVAGRHDVLSVGRRCVEEGEPAA